MAGKFFILRQVADFAPGFFAGTAMEDGCVKLGRDADGFVPEGSYTSVVFACEDFFALIPSWNADVPPGASVEMQVRVSVDGRWSRWVSFGVWSPYIRRASPATQADELAQAEGGILTITEGYPAATLAQMRILLKSEDPAQSPRVRLLALCTNATKTVGQEPPAFDRQLEMPAYSCQNRDPRMGARMASATTLCMLANRFGRDLLPEEVAHAVYDFGTGQYSNLAFLCAAAGAFGLTGHFCYAGISRLRREVWLGHAVAARVHYRAPGLGGQPTGSSSHPLPPVLESAIWDSTGHLVAVRGFSVRNGVPLVLVHDPLAQGDTAVPVELPLSTFSAIYTGLALFLEKGAPGAGADAPSRSPARPDIHDTVLRLFDGDGELVPARLNTEALNPSTLCYTLSDGVAYASAAQRKFYYPVADEHGSVRFDCQAARGRRMTVYLIGPTGGGWAAEKQLDG